MAASPSLNLVAAIFVSILLVVLGWNTYAATASRRRRRARALVSSNEFFDLAVCSEREFTKKALKLTLEGLRTKAGWPVRVHEYEREGKYHAVVVDLQHCREEIPPREGLLRIGVYGGPRRPDESQSVDAICRLHDRRRMLSHLGLEEEVPRIEAPSLAIWILLAIGIAFCIALMWR
jgi:hypothetical protein